MDSEQIRKENGVFKIVKEGFTRLPFEKLREKWKNKPKETQPAQPEEDPFNTTFTSIFGKEVPLHFTNPYDSGLVEESIKEGKEKMVELAPIIDSLQNYIFRVRNGAIEDISYKTEDTTTLPLKRELIATWDRTSIDMSPDSNRGLDRLQVTSHWESMQTPARQTEMRDIQCSVSKINSELLETYKPIIESVYDPIAKSRLEADEIFFGSKRDAEGKLTYEIIGPSRELAENLLPDKNGNPGTVGQLLKKAGYEDLYSLQLNGIVIPG